MRPRYELLECFHFPVVSVETVHFTFRFVRGTIRRGVYTCALYMYIYYTYKKYTTGNVTARAGVVRTGTERQKRSLTNDMPNR